MAGDLTQTPRSPVRNERILSSLTGLKNNLRSSPPINDGVAVELSLRDENLINITFMTPPIFLVAKLTKINHQK
jgi:hypothetical protein